MTLNRTLGVSCFASLALAMASCTPPPALPATIVAPALPAQTTQRPGPTPDRSKPGPWDNDVLVIRIGTDDGQARLGTFERAGVPTAARLQDGRLIAAYHAFPADDDRNFDRVAVRFSSDEGRTWSAPTPIVVESMEAGLARPFDPTLVPLPDGRVRLYFTSNRNADNRRSIPAIYSAISSDAIHYTFESGVRFAVEGRVVIDCAVALHEGVFHLIVPDNGTLDDLAAADARGAPPRGATGYHAISRDGLTFERLADVTLTGGDRWLGNLVSEGGRLVFFGTGPGPWPVTSVDGLTWERSASRSASRAQFQGADPGAVKLMDGSWLVIATGPPVRRDPSLQTPAPKP
jgi:hypothetical protein